jgi:hypothetical protein
MFRDCVGGKYYWSNPTFVSQVVESGHEVIMTPFFNRHPLVCFSSTTSAEDARSQVIGVVIYLNGHKPIHIILVMFVFLIMSVKLIVPRMDLIMSPSQSPRSVLY